MWHKLASALLMEPCLQPWQSVGPPAQGARFIHLSETLISSNLFNCLGYSVNIICVHDFIHPGMMYVDHSQTWQMTDAMMCWSRATPKSSSLHQSALGWRNSRYTPVSLPPSTPLGAPPSSSTLSHSCKGFGIKEDLKQNDPFALSWREQKFPTSNSCSRDARAAPVPSSAQLCSALLAR